MPASGVHGVWIRATIRAPEVPAGEEDVEQLLNERETRIVATVMALAEEGGFEAVRLRDVASRSGVALGTLYRHFRGKDDLLVAALALEAESLAQHMREAPPAGATALERAMGFFQAATDALCRRPKLTRAILRAACSDDPELAAKIRAFHGFASDLLISAICADPNASLRSATPRETRVSNMLQAVWFAAMLGWMSAQYKQEEVVEQVRNAAELVLG
jgi:TetR/AcrR family transcriptional regulator, cholesterol catabolism regulator